jgi:hypothetical protein
MIARKEGKMKLRFKVGNLKTYHAKIDAYRKQGWKQIVRVSSHEECYARLAHPNGHRLYISFNPQNGNLYEEML